MTEGRLLTPRSRLLRQVPIASGMLGKVDAVRAERDRLRAERDHLRAERDQLLLEADRARREEADISGALSAPSLLARTETLRRVRAISRERYGSADEIWKHNDKLAGQRLAESVGVLIPRRLVEPVHIRDLSCPDDSRFVVKPVNGAAGRGVTPLQEVSPGRYRNLFQLQDEATPWQAHREQLLELVRLGQVSPQFFVEELLEGPTRQSLPFDWKMFCIGGRAQFCYSRDTRNRRSLRAARFRYWTRDFEDLGPLRYPDRHDPAMAPPHHPEALVEAADRVATALLPTPFVRVDLFDTPNAVVFGEITPQPGTPLWFGEELDGKMGLVWDEFEAASWQL